MRHLELNETELTTLFYFARLYFGKLPANDALFRFQRKFVLTQAYVLYTRKLAVSSQVYSNAAASVVRCKPETHN